MIINVQNSTYQYKKPFVFCDNGYSDSKSLVEAVLDNWDEALTAFRCEEWNDFWDTYVDAETSVKKENTSEFAMICYSTWDAGCDTNIDILFSKVIHYLEPAMKEIPYFVPGETIVSLWGVEDFKCFFQRDLSRKEVDYLAELISNDLIDKEEREFDADKEAILYSCQMLKEEIFSLYGYTGAEDEFHKTALGIVEKNSLVEIAIRSEDRQGVQKEELVEVYQGVANRLIREFVYKGEACSSLDAFCALWKEECVKWSIKEWDAFIDMIYERKEGALSFRQWLVNLGEQDLHKSLGSWNRRWNGLRNEIEQITPSQIHHENLFDHYSSFCSQKQFMNKVSAYEKSVEAFQHRIRNNSKRQRMEVLWNLYVDFYQCFERTVNSMPAIDSCAFKADLDALTGKWKVWEEENQRICDEQKMISDSVRNYDVLSCWNHDFAYKHRNNRGDVVGSRHHLALLACAPIKENYQKNCEAFLQLLKAGGEGCTPEAVKQYAEHIFSFIYLPLVKASMKPDNETKKTIEEMLEYYFRLLEKMSKIFSETMWVSYILSDKEYKEWVFKNHNIQDITTKLQAVKLVDVEALEAEERSLIIQKESYDKDGDKSSEEVDSVSKLFL